MRRGYIPLDVTKVPFIFAAHLPGVTAPVDGFAIGEIRISRLTFEECRLIEKSRFMDDLQDVFVYGREPWFIVFGGYPGENENGVALIKANAATSIVRLTRALRLLKDGEVWDPLEFILYSRHNSTNTRDPRLFGRLAFQLRREDFVALSLEDIDSLDGIYAALDLFDRFRFDLEIDRAEALLGASFSPAHVSFAHRMLPLLGAIEILADHEIGMLADAQWADDRLRLWVDRFRSSRNLLAHGRRDDPGVLHEMLVSTRAVCRVLLREAIAWRLLDPEISKVTGGPLVQRAQDRRAGGPERLATLETAYATLFNPGTGK